MTGFGRGEAGDDRYSATAEIRSVNNRFCEVRVRGSRVIGAFETEAQNMIKAALSRGKIDASIQVSQIGDFDLGLSVNAGVAKAYARLLEDLIAATTIEDRVGLDDLLSFSDIFERESENGDDVESAWIVARLALERALEGLKEMRRQEGAALQRDLVLRIDTIESELNAVGSRAPERVAEAREKLRVRLEELVADERLDPARLETEVAILADRLDVTEELVRLRSHIELFREALNAEEPVGRRLNFLAQEMNREINTIGSKANDAEIAHRAIAMKEALEQIREQVNNVE